MVRKMDAETGRAMSAQRKRGTVICIECKKPIENVTARRLYHPACRELMRARRRRAKAKESAAGCK